MKTITNEQYYHAMALYMVACHKQAEVDVLEREMNDILGEEQGSHASDAIYTYETKGSKELFDYVLINMDIKVTK